MPLQSDTVARLDDALTNAAVELPDATSFSVALDGPRIGRWRRGIGPGDARVPSASEAERPFRIASITKPFVAATLRRLARRDSILLEAPIRSLLAADTLGMLVSGGFDVDAITPEHLLSHTSGLVDHSTLPEYESAVLADPQKRWTRREQVALAMEHRRPLGRPGEYYSYSDTGYVLLGEIVERLTGRSLAEAVRGELQFEALELRHTWWENLEPGPRGAPPLARQYQGEIDVTDFHPSFDLYGGGGLVSTVGDLSSFARALLDGTLLRPRELISGLRTPAARRDPSLEPWRTHGYLVATFKVGGRWLLGHTGAWGSAMAYSPDVDVAIAATVNRSGNAARARLFDLMDRLISIASQA